MDQVVQLGAGGGEVRGQVLVGLRRQAEQQAEEAGALPGSCRLAAVDVLPLTYMPGGGGERKARL